MKVALFKAEGDGGWIEIYEVDGGFFDSLLCEVYPTCEEDWREVARRVESRGALVRRIKTDYSIWLDKPVEP
jgi:hypothetical protein